MTNYPLTLTMTLRSVIASCIVCSLLTLPSLASAQENFGTLDNGSGSKIDPPAQAAETPPVESKPGDQLGQPLTPATADGAAGETKAKAGSAKAGSAKAGSAKAGQEGDNPESELTLEEQRAAWMAELEQLTFQELIKRIRDDERQINKLYINMPITNPQEQLRFEKYIAGLQGEVTVLNQLLEPAAVEAFRSNPMESKAATAKVFEVLASKLSPRGQDAKYDPGAGLRLVNTILEIKGGDVGMDPALKPTPEEWPFLDIIWQGYLASYGLQDFKSADEFLTRLENANIGLDPRLRADFEATLVAWEIESTLRSEEEKMDDLPRVKLETTDGDVVIELFENQAPNTVANFIKLVKEGYYDGLEFFHVVPSSYARSGCKANDGTTNPGYRIRNEFENGRRHFAGTVVMQNDGENTAGSQFIILHRADPNMAGKVVAFGRVIEGLDLVYGFKPVNRIRSAGGKATVINKATILRDRGHEYEPEIIEDATSLLRQAGEVMSDGSQKSSTTSPPTRPRAPLRIPTQGSSTSGSSNRLQP